MRYLLFFLSIGFLISCQQPQSQSAESAEKDSKEISLKDYFDYGESVETAGVKMIPINTPVGEFKVWTKRFGKNPKIKILLLHGGPAMTHEYLESFETFFQREGFEFYEYDQLGSFYSDQPDDESLWTIERFVDEVDQVRQAINADSTNFYLIGNSWGGLLSMEYALKHQDQLKGIVVSNMMASVPEYNTYVREVLAKQMPEEVVKEILKIEEEKDYVNPRYEELLMEHYYSKHICRLEEWPDGVVRGLSHTNDKIYTLMQGPSEFGVSGDAILKDWDIKDRLKDIHIPTLMVGAKYDSMNPEAMEEQSKLVQNGRYLHCPNGSHMAMWDDQEVFMDGVIKFIKDVDKGEF